MALPIYFVSDRTGITAELLGRALISQFSELEFELIPKPYVDSSEKAAALIDEINTYADTHDQKPIIFATIVNDALREQIETSHGICFDFFNAFMGPLSDVLNTKPKATIGKQHGIADKKAYDSRIDAVNFALSHDDGLATNSYDKADVILIGVSRSGKTPTSLYLALQYGIFAANYPFVDEDLEQLKLPNNLKQHADKLFGLTITPERLHEIRSERRAHSDYASPRQCRYEINEVEKLYQREQILFLDTTKHSIEEIATKIMAMKGLVRR